MGCHTAHAHTKTAIQLRSFITNTHQVKEALLGLWLCCATLHFLVCVNVENMLIISKGTRIFLCCTETIPFSKQK